jgi:hypothetical protein
MRTAGTIAATLGAITTIAIADDQAPERKLQDLLDHGFTVMAEGRLVDFFECAPEYAPITIQEIRKGYSCSSSEARYGAFKRLKAGDNEFVCVSFRNWTCYPSASSN